VKKILITGTGGLIGSAAAEYYLDKGWHVYGVDNNMRKKFFGDKGSVESVIDTLKLQDRYSHYSHDIRDNEAMQHIFKYIVPDAIIHCAAQPSHDKAAEMPYDDFFINAVGTLNLLEATRLNCKDSPFVFMSTNKVYGDTPNKLSYMTLSCEENLAASYIPMFSTYVTGLEQGCEGYGFTEKLGIDRCMHSLFGASKLSADILAQEYGKYYDMPTCTFRGGCLTGPQHSGVELHGFLSYIVHCAVHDKEYTIYGHDGRQVRDQIHSYDVVKAFDEYIKDPSSNGVVYNIGGEAKNAASINEVVARLEKKLGKKMLIKHSENARKGDHMWYVTNMNSFRKDYRYWFKKYDLDAIIDEIVDSEISKVTK
jgi:CDP-paratose 2-epimerase